MIMLNICILLKLLPVAKANNVLACCSYLPVFPTLSVAAGPFTPIQVVNLGTQTYAFIFFKNGRAM